MRRLLRRWRRLEERRDLDLFRRAVELLDQAERPGVTLHTDYWRRERDLTVADAREALRRLDPDGRTDRAYR